MRELTKNEMDQASGGFLPLVGFGLALLGKVTGSTGVLGWAVGSTSLIIGTYQAAEWVYSSNHSNNQ